MFALGASITRRYVQLYAGYLEWGVLQFCPAAA
jgi:hypothetical protein